MIIAQPKDSRDYYTKLWDKVRGRNSPMERVRVRITRGTDETNILPGIIMLVQVYSRALPGRIKQGEKFFDFRDDSKNMRQVAGVMAGALAEECCEHFGDSFDPSEAAKMGMEAFEQVVAESMQSGRLTQGLIIE
jgi:hypothetical protein